MVKKLLSCAVLLASATIFMAGCGYTQKNLLPEHIKNVHVKPVKNDINLGEEVSDKKPLKIYRPGIEVEVTNAIINRFIFDGNFHVTDETKADALLTASLTDYRREPVRYSDGDNVKEYRLSVEVSAIMTDVRTQKVLWNSNITGDTTFFLEGTRSVSEDEAVQKAVEDLARRVVDRTIEVW